MVHEQSSQQTQRELYGETWAERFTKLRDFYKLSQAELAAIIGLSAPMVSQLVRGQRVKISNPVVHGRIVYLEELFTDPEVIDYTPEQMRYLLENVKNSTPQFATTTFMGTTEVHQVVPEPDEGAHDRLRTVKWLAANATAPVLAELAGHANSLGSPQIASALAESAELQKK